MILSIGFTFITACQAIYGGGIKSSGIIWFSAVPLINFLFLGGKASLKWLLTIIVILISLYIWHDYLHENWIHHETLNKSTNLQSVLPFTLLMMFLLWLDNVGINRLSSRVKRQQKFLETKNKLIEKKNVEIVTQQEELISSIRYAQRIQDALLPNELLEKTLTNNAFSSYFHKCS